MRELLGRSSGLVLLALLVLVAVLSSSALAQTKASTGEGPKEKVELVPTIEPKSGEELVPGQIIVKFKEDTSPSAQSDARRREGLDKEKDLNLIDAEVDKVKGQSVEEAIRDLESRPDVEYATPDRRVYPTGFADEPRFAELWGLHNTGQKINGSVGAADVDVNAKEASAITQGDPKLVVAVIDDGVDFSHPDLKDRAWKNPGESGMGKETNHIDDDGNGFVDDVNGWDFYNEDNTVHDSDDFHGTHVSGTIAASVNGQGIVGVAPNVKVMAIKFIGPAGGTISDAIDAIGYAKSKGAKISNNSWGYLGPPDPALKDAIGASGQLFVTAAGNYSIDNDADRNNAQYPASYTSPNVLSVAAVDHRGNLWGFSSYGEKTVDVSAPGAGILSSVPGNSWKYFNGTSQATPHATGAAALAASKDPSLLGKPTALKKVLLDTGKPVSDTAGKTVTGDMINAQAAAARGDTTAPTAKPPVQSFIRNSTLGNTTVPVKLAWSATDNVGGGGIARYKLQQSTNGHAYAKVTLASATATSTARSLTPKYTYRFRVRAQDYAGNWSTWAYGLGFAVEQRQEDYQAVSYTGRWPLQALSTASDGYVRYTTAYGAKAKFSFAGRNVAWVAPKGPDRGKAEVWIDGVKVATVDLYSSSAQPRKMMFTKSWSSSDSHTLEVRATDTKNASSSGKRVDVDAFVALR
jgi:subtilisin family serine protease